MTTCGDAQDLIERHLDGEITEAQKDVLAAHLSGCATCSQLFERETAVDAALTAAFAHAEPSPQLRPRIRDRVRREPVGEWWGWISDGLNTVGVLVMFGFATELLGPEARHLAPTAIWIVAGALAVGLYPLWLARLGGNETEPS